MDTQQQYDLAKHMSTHMSKKRKRVQMVSVPFIRSETETSLPTLELSSVETGKT